MASGSLCARVWAAVTALTAFGALLSLVGCAGEIEPVGGPSASAAVAPVETLRPTAEPSAVAGAPAARSDVGDRSSLAAICSDDGARPESARDACTRLLTPAGALPPRAEAQVRLNRGLAHAALADHADAIADFDAAAALEPTLYPLWVARGWTLLSLGRPEDALASFDHALTLQKPADGNPLADEMDLVAGRGAALLDAGRADEALPLLERLARARFDDPLVQYRYALALAAAGRADEADAAFTAVAKMVPSDPAPIVQRALLREPRDPESALLDYDEAEKLAPGAARIPYLRGRLLDRLGQTARANEDLRRAWRLGWRDEWLQSRIVAIGG